MMPTSGCQDKRFQSCTLSLSGPVGRGGWGHGVGMGWDRDRWGETGWMLGGVGIRGGCGARDREGWVHRYATCMMGVGWVSERWSE